MKSVVFFDLGNLFAECRLGDVQSVGSPREVQFSAIAMKYRR